MYNTLKNGANHAHTLKRHTRLISLTLVLLIGSFFSVSGYSQTTTIKGKVTDTSGTSLPGVSIKATGTSTGTISDLNGSYTLTLQKAVKSLTFSYVGMVTQEVAIENKTTINVTLSENAVNVNEVVVIGYGTQKKSDLTGSIAVVDTKAMAKAATNDVTKALQGQVA